jgi:hypothetical protein
MVKHRKRSHPRKEIGPKVSAPTGAMPQLADPLFRARREPSTIATSGICGTSRGAHQGLFLDYRQYSGALPVYVRIQGLKGEAHAGSR